MQYKLDNEDDICDLLEPKPHVTTLKDMIKDYNTISIKVSEFSSEELKDNFWMDYQYVNYLGIVDDNYSQLISKQTTLSDFEKFFFQKYIEFLKRDMQNLRELLGNFE